MKCIQCNKIAPEENLLDFTVNSYVYTYYMHKYDDDCDEKIYVCDDCIQDVYDKTIIHIKKIKIYLKSKEL